jgi:hypothetical protein
MRSFGPFLGEVVRVVVETTPLEAVDLRDIAAESLEGDGVARFLGLDTVSFPNEVGRKGEVWLQKL